MTILNVRVRINDAGTLTSSPANGIYAHYAVVVNNLNPNLIDPVPLTLNPITWTDVLDFIPPATLLHYQRIQKPAYQGVQWAQPVSVSPGTGNESSTSFLLSVPLSTVGSPQRFYISVITYLNQNQQNIFDNSFPVDPLGSIAAVEFIDFDRSIKNSDSKTDPLGDYTILPPPFPQEDEKYKSFDLKSLEVFMSQ